MLAALGLILTVTKTYKLSPASNSILLKLLPAAPSTFILNAEVAPPLNLMLVSNIFC